MEAFGFLFAWYNLPFVVALGCCFGLALLQILSGGGDSEGEAELDSEAELEAEGELDGTEGAGGSLWASALAALGVGQLPLLLILIALLGSFGSLGLLLSAISTTVIGPSSALSAPLVLLIAFGLAFFATGRISKMLYKVAGNYSTAINAEQLVGRVGTVVSERVSTSYGRVAVRDQHGTVHTVFAIIRQGEALPLDTEVALVEYDGQKRQFVVKAMR